MHAYIEGCSHTDRIKAERGRGQKQTTVAGKEGGHGAAKRRRTSRMTRKMHATKGKHRAKAERRPTRKSAEHSSATEKKKERAEETTKQVETTQPKASGIRKDSRAASPKGQRRHAPHNTSLDGSA